MDAGLENFIKDNFIVDKADLLLETFELFALAELEGFENRFLEIVMTSSSRDVAETPLMFEDWAYTLVSNTLLEHGIKLSEDAPLMVANQFFDAVLNLQYYTGTEDVLRVLETDMETEEKFVELVKFISPIDESRALLYLEEVDPSLISRINDLFSVKEYNTSEDTTTQEIVARCVNKYRHVNRFLRDANTITYRLVKAGVFIGSEFSEYLPYLSHKFDDMIPEQLGLELFSLLAITKDGVDNPMQCFQEHADQLFSDLVLIANVNTQITKLAASFELYLQNRRLITANEEFQNEEAYPVAPMAVVTVFGTKPAASATPFEISINGITAVVTGEDIDIKATDEQLNALCYPSGNPGKGLTGRAIYRTLFEDSIAGDLTNTEVLSDTALPAFNKELT